MIALFALVLAVSTVHGAKVLTQPRARVRRPSTPLAVLVTLMLVVAATTSAGAASFTYDRRPPRTLTSMSSSPSDR